MNEVPSKGELALPGAGMGWSDSVGAVPGRWTLRPVDAAAAPLLPHRA